MARPAYRCSYEALLDYRRNVADLYRKVRTGAAEPEARWAAFRRGRDRLFRTHPQSALSEAQKAAFRGLRYYPYNPKLRFELPVDLEVENEIFEIELQDDGLFPIERFGKVHFEVEGQRVALSLFWVKIYGGGIFMPFRDRTNQDESYAGGRYLLDTIKGADLGHTGAALVIDFNYAYNPSCAYNPRWHCPLAPQENWLPVPIRAGEKRYLGASAHR